MARIFERKSRIRRGLGAVAILEQAVHLLRATPAALVLYYAGSLPFILGLLYFWADMSAGAFAADHLAAAALGLTVLFSWMKTWQSLYARRLLAEVRGMAPTAFGAHRILRTAVLQTIVQPWAAIVLPVAFALMLPFGWAQAFFHNFTVTGTHEESFQAMLKRSRHYAGLWPGQNMLIIWLASPFLLSFIAALLFVLMPFLLAFNPESSSLVLISLAMLAVTPLAPLTVVIAANVGALLIIIPGLMRMLFGIETSFSLSGSSLISTTFFAVVWGMSYLLLDPLIKAAYCLRCFYGEALATGEDLRVSLRAVTRGSVLIIVLTAGLATAVDLHAAQVSSASPMQSVDVQTLDSSIAGVIENPEYAWHLPREQKPPRAHESWLHKIVKEVVTTIATWAHKAGAWLAKVWRWIKKILAWLKPDFPAPQERASPGWGTITRAMIIGLLTGIGILLLGMAWRAWRVFRLREAAAVPVQVRPAPDIRNEEVLASELPEDGWLLLAQDLLVQGELRLALRAFYLASLAYLGQRGLIIIARHKSDLDYDRELQRRAHAVPVLCEAFTRNVRLFEAAWYGIHAVDRAYIDQFRHNQEQIRNHAQI